MPRRAVAPIAGRGQTVSARMPAPTQTAHPSALMVPVDQLVPDPGQPRRHFDETALAELAESVKREGILQPLLVREDGALPDGRSRYAIIAGGRRHRAAQLAGLAAVPVVVHAETRGSNLRILQLIENLQREDLDALEEAVAIRELMQLANLSLEGVASRIGKPKSYAQRRVELLFDPRLTDAVRRGAINASVALELRRFPQEQRSRYLERIEAGERLEVAQLREEKRRARQILFGDERRRDVGAGNQSPARTEDRAAGTPEAGESYRIDTAEPPANGNHISPLTPRDSHASGVSTPLAVEAGLEDVAGSYRFDTAIGVPGSPEYGSAARESHAEKSGRSDVQAEDTQVTRWAAGVVEQIMLPDQSSQAVLKRALRQWRDAGSREGWGDALLRVLAERLGDS